MLLVNLIYLHINDQILKKIDSDRFVLKIGPFDMEIVGYFVKMYGNFWVGILQLHKIYESLRMRERTQKAIAEKYDFAKVKHEFLRPPKD